jgi:osmotically-inducible protein OsmY
VAAPAKPLDSVSPSPAAREGADDGLLTAVRAALRSSGYRPLWDLRCQVSDGVVTLSGVVPSYHLKQLAQTVVLRLHQVRGLRNRAEVDQARTQSAG